MGDLSDEEVCCEAGAATTAHFGGIDILINNAGVGLFATASESSLQCAGRVFEVNLWAPIALTRLVLPQLRERGSGAICCSCSLSTALVIIGPVSKWF